MLFVLLALGLATGASGAASSAGQASGSPVAAITGFSGSDRRVDASFEALNTLALSRPDELRAAALAHLADTSPLVRFAAVYALSATAEAGASDDALAGVLTSGDPPERALAAVSLARQGKLAQAVPTLIDSLSSSWAMPYWDPPEAVWEFARYGLVTFTGKDFGLARAANQGAAIRTQPTWRQWATTLKASSPSVPPIVTVPGTRHAASAAATGGTHLSVSGDTVTITVDIDVTPPPVYGTPPTNHLGEWQKAANDAWNAAFKNFRYHPAEGCGSSHARDAGYRLKAKITFHGVPAGTKPTAGHDVVTFSSSITRSGTRIPGFSADHRVDNSSPYASTGTGQWNPTRGMLTIIHEAGHLAFGLGDDYNDPAAYPTTDRGSTAGWQTGRAGTIMDGGSRIDQNLVNRVGKQAATQVSLPPRCPHTKAPPPPSPPPSTGGPVNYKGKSDQGEVVYLSTEGDRLTLFNSIVNVDCPETGQHTAYNKFPVAVYVGRVESPRYPAELPLKSGSFEVTDHTIPGNVQVYSLKGRVTGDSASGTFSGRVVPPGDSSCPWTTAAWHATRVR